MSLREHPVTGAVLLTFPLVNLSISSVETVTIKTDTFSTQEGLKQFTMENIGKVVLEKFCYSSKEMSGHITHFKMENVMELQMESGNCFDNFLQCSHVVFNKVGMNVNLIGFLFTIDRFSFNFW